MSRNDPYKRISTWYNGVRAFRPPDVFPQRHGILWLLGAALAVLSLHALRIPAWITASCMALLAWRYMVESRGLRVPGRLLRLALLATAVLAVWLDFRTVAGRDAGVALLLILTCLKVIEIKSVRDCMLAVFLLYFCTLTAFLFEQDVVTGIQAMVVAAVVTVTLVRISQPESLNTARMRGDIISMVIAAVPVMIIIYLLFPRIQGSLWGLPEDAFSGRTGLSDQVTPGSINRLHLNDEVAFRVEFSGPRPAAEKQYWRAMVLTVHQGRSWRQSSFAIPTPLEFESSDGRVDYSITYEPKNRNWLPVLDMPALQPVGTWLKHGYAIEARRPLTSRRKIDLVSYTEYRTRPMDRITRMRSLSLHAPVSERTRLLIDQWRQSAADDAALADTVLAYFRNQPFFYTLTPPLLGNDPVDEFLFESRRGYCEHYATTFTTLMRAAGIPARVVVGYQGGEWNEPGDYLIVRQSDAHAWSEVWLDDRGWVRIDPTAAVAPERIELGMNALRELTERGEAFGSLQSSAVRELLRGNWFEQGLHQMQLRWDSVNNLWNEWVMAYGPENQRLLLQRLGFINPSWHLMVGLLVVLLALIFSGYGWSLFRKRGRPPPEVGLYRQFCSTMARLGLHRLPHEGPLTFSRRCATAHPQLSASIDAFAQGYNAIRYGPDPDPDLLRRISRLLHSMRRRRPLAARARFNRSRPG